MERTSAPVSSPPVPPPATPAPHETAGPSSTSQQSPEHIPVSSRELSTVMDVVCTLATTQASLDKRMARAEVTLVHNHAMLLWIMKPPRSPASQRDKAYTAHYLRLARCIHSRSLLGYACSRCNSFRSIDVYTTTRVRWLHSLLYLSDPYPVETWL